MPCFDLKHSGLLHIGESSYRPRSVPMQPHVDSVVMCLLLHSMVGSKTHLSFYATCGESVQSL
jgi:hypothetical protein